MTEINAMSEVVVLSYISIYEEIVNPNKPKESIVKRKSKRKK